MEVAVCPKSKPRKQRNQKVSFPRSCSEKWDLDPYSSPICDTVSSLHVFPQSRLLGQHRCGSPIALCCSAEIFPPGQFQLSILLKNMIPLKPLWLPPKLKQSSLPHTHSILYTHPPNTYLVYSNTLISFLSCLLDCGFFQSWGHVFFISHFFFLST